MHVFISLLTRWKSCDGVELLVNVDSRTVADVEWLNSTADRVVFSKNVHEIRAFNSLAKMARAPIVAFVQDDMPPPIGCEYIGAMESMFDGDERLGVIGWRTFALVPYYHRWQGHTYQRRTVAKLTWWGHSSNMRAMYAAMVDVGPIFSRADTFHHVGGFNERFSEPGFGGFYHDYEFSLRTWLHGWKVAFYDASFNLCFDCLGPYLKQTASANAPVRGKASYSDANSDVQSNRTSIMQSMRYLYDNISAAVERNNERLGAGCTWGYPSEAHAPLPPRLSLDECCDAWGRGQHPNIALVNYMKNVSNLC